MDILLYASSSLIGQLQHFEFVPFPDTRPALPRSKECILLIEDWYETKEGLIQGRQEVMRLRKNHCQQPIVIIDRGSSNPINRSIERVLQDPFVQEVSFQALKAAAFNRLRIESMFVTDLNIEERDQYFIDLRKNLYSNSRYLSMERHYVLSKLQQLDDLSVAISFLRQSLQELKHFLTREKLYTYVQSELQKSLSLLSDNKDIPRLTELGSKTYALIKEKIVEKETTAYRQPTHKTLLYIGTSLDTWRKLQDALDTFFGKKIINCLYAKNGSEALRVLTNNSAVSLTFADYRFWLDTHKLAPINGYILVNRLWQIFPGHRFCFLTNQPQEIDILPNKMTNNHVFDKQLLIQEQNPLEFARLFKVVFANDYITGQDFWPSDTRTDTDKLYAKVYNRYRQLPNRDEIKAHSNKRASDIVHELIMHGQTKHLALFGNSQLKTIIPANQLEYLKGILTARKIIVALFNLKGLPTKFFELLKEDDKRRKVEPATRPCFDIIYCLLSSRHKVTKYDNKEVSRFFTDTFRIKISCNYRLDNPKLNNYLTLEEIQWLSDFLQTHGNL